MTPQLEPSAPSPAQHGAGSKGRVPVLCVDDEPAVLHGLKLHLRRSYDVAVAQSGEAGLALIEQGLEPAVIISDMRMPGMSGAAFLARARETSPHSARILLTGHTDLDAAISAVNDGQIFRFLTKPCPPPALLATVEAGAEQHRLLTAEKVLLEQTLRGSVRALTEVLALTHPEGFGRGTRLRRLVAQLSEQLGIQDAWQVEVAAMLSQLGCIVLPPETATRVFNAESLSNAEKAMVEQMPAVTDQLLANIPRLEGVRAILARQGERHPAQPGEDPESALGAQILRVAADFDVLEMRGMTPSAAVDILRGREKRYDSRVVEALVAARAIDGGGQLAREAPLSALRVGMLLAADLRLSNGTLVLTRGFEITESSLERLRNFAGSVKEPVHVIVPDPRGGA
jgi:response regulator RpfG family c-di-GMP phosphodiesterase